MRVKAALLLVAFAASTLSATTPVAPTVGRCVNIGNHLEAPNEGDWGGKRIDADDFRRIAAAGFNTVRLPVRWSSHAGHKPPYAIDPAFLRRVRDVVAFANASGLRVILNDHNFDDLHKDPGHANVTRLAGLWQQIGSAFATADNDRLWFEIENEPHDQINNANLIAVLGPALREIRLTNPQRPVVWGGEFWSGIDSLATLPLPEDPALIPTFHYYEPFDFTHQGATWINPVPPMGRVYGTEADRSRLGADQAKVRAFIARTGKVPFVGESGANEKIPVAQRVLYLRKMREGWDQLGLGLCAWGYINTFPLWDQQSKRWIPGMLEAMGLPEAPRRR
jgi:endoglucanase